MNEYCNKIDDLNAPKFTFIDSFLCVDYWLKLDKLRLMIKLKLLLLLEKANFFVGKRQRILSK